MLRAPRRVNSGDVLAVPIHQERQLSRSTRGDCRIGQSRRGGQAFLPAACPRKFAAYESGGCGDRVALCVRSIRQHLLQHGVATIKLPPARFQRTPESVAAIYGEQTDRVFVLLSDVSLVPPVQVEGLSAAESALFNNGRASVRLLSDTAKTALRAVEAPSPIRSVEVGTFNHVRSVTFIREVTQRVYAIGLDPTAGTWESKMTAGVKPMPSALLVLTPGGEIEPVSMANRICPLAAMRSAHWWPTEMPTHGQQIRQAGTVRAWRPLGPGIGRDRPG